MTGLKLSALSQIKVNLATMGVIHFHVFLFKIMCISFFFVTFFFLYHVNFIEVFEEDEMQHKILQMEQIMCELA